MNAPDRLPAEGEARRIEFTRNSRIPAWVYTDPDVYRREMERIFYRGFVYFLGSSSSFHDARVATIQAATELYGSASAETTAVTDAWTAVGVF